MKNNSFFKSLYHALCGYRDALKRERNLRFHTVVANLICFFAVHYKISRTEWAILITVIGLVIACELLNSAVEKAVDTATHDVRADAMHAKDFAAAATLVGAVCAIGTGIALFGNINAIASALKLIFTTPASLIILAILTVADLKILFINFRRKL